MQKIFDLKKETGSNSGNIEDVLEKFNSILLLQFSINAKSQIYNEHDIFQCLEECFGHIASLFYFEHKDIYREENITDKILECIDANLFDADYFEGIFSVFNLQLDTMQ